MCPLADSGPVLSRGSVSAPGFKGWRAAADGREVSAAVSTTTPSSSSAAAQASSSTPGTTGANASRNLSQYKGTTAQPQLSVTERIQQFGNDWLGFASLLFIVLFGVVMWRTLKSMPRTKPVEIRPDAGVEVNWEDIAGVDEAKKEPQEVVDFLKAPTRFKRLGASVPAGVLLHGPPGTGKTLLAKAVAHESGATFYAQSASSFVEMFAGVGAARIRKLFEKARQNAPSIVFIDELDTVGTRRTGMGNNREHDQTLNQLLVELDGFANADQVVVMAASNRIQDLDPALLRPGRFDRQLLVAPPDLAGREKILEVHTRGKPLSSDIDLHAVARQTAGLAGADLANICNEAAIFAG